MERIKVIVVQSEKKGLSVAHGAARFLEVALETNADQVLEAVREYFRNRWKAKVHALQWLFPEDLLLSGTTDHTPHLVVCAETLGRLPVLPDREKHRGIPNDHSHKLLAVFRMAAENPSQAEHWSLPAWLPNTSSWIRRQFHDVQRISQVRTCPNGAVIRIQCAEGTYYLKTQSRALAYEWALLRTLNRREPGSCPRVLDIRPDLNSHLTEAIRRCPLDAPGQPFALRRLAVRAVASLQIRTIPFVEDLCSQHIPHHPLESLGSRLRETLNRIVHMQSNSPNTLTPRELKAIAKLVTKSAPDLESLDRCGLPHTLIHGDLNWSNIFSTETGEITLIDWSLSRVTHPFFTLSSTVFAHVDGRRQMLPEHKVLCEAYLAMWSEFAPLTRLRSALDAASRLFWIDSSMAIASLCQPGHIRNLINLPRFLRAALRAYNLAC